MATPNRTETIRFRVTPEEKAEIQKRAERVDFKLSDYVRKVVLHKREPARISKEEDPPEVVIADSAAAQRHDKRIPEATGYTTQQLQQLWQGQGKDPKTARNLAAQGKVPG